MTKGMDKFEIHSEQGIAAALEAKRLAEKYNKDVLDCKVKKAKRRGRAYAPYPYKNG